MGADETDPNAKKPNAIVRFVSHPLFGGVVGMVGIALAIYFYYLSREVPDLTYYVHPVKAAVVRTGQMSRLSMQFDGQEITSDVTAAQVAFWNAGRRAIHGNTILEPLTIRTGNKARILEVRLQKMSRDITGIKVDASHLSEGEVSIRWNILEHNDGGVLQLVYAGDESVDILAHSILEGQPVIVRVDYPETLATPGEQYARSEAWRAWSFVAFFVMGSFTFFLTLKGIPREIRHYSTVKVARGVLFATCAFAFGVGIWILFAPRGPPFGL